MTKRHKRPDIIGIAIGHSAPWFIWTSELEPGQFWCETPGAIEIWQGAHREKRFARSRISFIYTAL